MAKRCTTFEHPSDLGLQARADSLGELFEALAEGVAGHLCLSGAAVRETRSVSASAGDMQDLLVDFLVEVLKLFDLDRLVPVRVRVEAIDETSVRAEVGCERYDPARHELGPEIKAVTYHQLRVAREGAGWVGRVILDL